ncbi:MAG TPA: DUF4382 domain-containing protein [Quisquiliibacterium sp.]|nr:DUF4382 domain-containing protein [Quisquiliibacterium sp.]
MQNHLPRRILGVAALAGAAMLAGCGGGGASDTSGTISGGGGTGTLRVSLTDAPACGYDAVNVTVERVRVHQSASATGGTSEAGWSEIVLSPPRKVDLLQLTNGVLFELGQVALPAGNYQQIRLVLADNSSVPLANSVVPSGKAETPLDTPSGQQSGIKLQANVAVPAGETMDVVLDFDACRSVVKRGNSGQYNLKPVISVIPLVSAGAISGYVPTGLLADGVTVTAQSGGTVVKATVPDPTGAFRLSPIASGTYNVVFTADDRTTRVVSGVPVVTGGNSVLSLPAQPITLPPSMTVPPSGTISGQVVPAAAQAEVRATQTVGAAMKVVVRTAVADGLTGGYSFKLPLANAQLANWGTGLLPLVFADVVGTGGKYVFEASAVGYLPNPAFSALLTLGAVTLDQDFVLTAAP